MGGRGGGLSRTRGLLGKCVILTRGENVKAVMEYHNLPGGGIGNKMQQKGINLFSPSEF